MSSSQIAVIDVPRLAKSKLDRNESLFSVFFLPFRNLVRQDEPADATERVEDFTMADATDVQLKMFDYAILLYPCLFERTNLSA